MKKEGAGDKHDVWAERNALIVGVSSRIAIGRVARYSFVVWYFGLVRKTTRSKHNVRKYY